MSMALLAYVRVIAQSEKLTLDLALVRIQGFYISLAMCAASAAIVSPVFTNSRLWQERYFGNKFFCQFDMTDGSKVLYMVVSTSLHFFLTFVTVCVLYLAIYVRLRSR